MLASRKETTGEPPIRDSSIQSLIEPWGIDLSRIAQLRSECEIFSEICADYEECSAKLLSLVVRAESRGPTTTRCSGAIGLRVR